MDGQMDKGRVKAPRTHFMINGLGRTQGGVNTRQGSKWEEEANGKLVKGTSGSEARRVEAGAC